MNIVDVINSNGIVAIGGGLVFSAAASALPPPKDNSTDWYKFLYKFMNGLAANVSALRGKAQYEEKP